MRRTFSGYRRSAVPKCFLECSRVIPSQAGAIGKDLGLLPTLGFDCCRWRPMVPEVPTQL
jgi:hypothetical protein